MDIQQPQAYGMGMGGGYSGGANTRFLQDVYRSIKCPNFSAYYQTNVALSNGAWHRLVFDTVQHNHLNCLAATKDYCAPTVPGYYMMHTQAQFAFPDAGLPTANALLYFGISNNAGTLVASQIYTLPNATTGMASGAHVLTFSTSYLGYCDGTSTGTDAKARYSVVVYNGSGQTMRVIGREAGNGFTSTFQAHKITY